MATIHHTMTLCPFVKQPFSECAIRVITGSTIPTISRLCMSDYPLCPVYQREHQHVRPDNHDIHVPESLDNCNLKPEPHMLSLPDASAT